MIVNPVGVARRVNVLSPTPRSTSVPKARSAPHSYTDDGVWAVVELAAFGYAWVPASRQRPPRLAPMDLLSIKDRTLQNDLITVSLDDKSGGIRGVHGPVEPTARLGQQLVIVGSPTSRGSRRSRR